MIEVDHAVALAADRLHEIEKKSAIDLVIVEREDRPRGWVFYYNSRKFVETQEFRYLIGGNGPIVVTHDGAVDIGPTLGLDSFLDERLGPKCP